MENLGNLFQFIIGAGLEVGLTLTGFGAPLAPFAEMANDAIFLAMGAGGTITAVKNLFSGGNKNQTDTTAILLTPNEDMLDWAQDTA